MHSFHCFSAVLFCIASGSRTEYHLQGHDQHRQMLSVFFMNEASNITFTEVEKHETTRPDFLFGGVTYGDKKESCLLKFAFSNEGGGVCLLLPKSCQEGMS